MNNKIYTLVSLFYLYIHKSMDNLYILWRISLPIGQVILLYIRIYQHDLSSRVFKSSNSRSMYPPIGGDFSNFLMAYCLDILGDNHEGT